MKLKDAVLKTDNKKGLMFLNKKTGGWETAHIFVCKVCKEEAVYSLSKTKTSPNSGKFCGHLCSQQGRMKTVRVPCDYCGKIHDRTPSELERAHFHFCSKECHQKGQRFDSGIMYDGYGNNTSQISFSATRIKTWICECCGEKRGFLLQVHHKDHDRNNNPLDGSNWEILCANCHITRHLEFDVLTKKWFFKTHALTDRALLPMFDDQENPDFWGFRKRLTQNDKKEAISAFILGQGIVVEQHPTTD